MRCARCNKDYQQSTNTLPSGYCSQKCVDDAAEAYKDTRIAELEAQNQTLRTAFTANETDNAEYLELIAELEAQLSNERRQFEYVIEHHANGQGHCPVTPERYREWADEHHEKEQS